jgi:hypothetical protein
MTSWSLTWGAELDKVLNGSNTMSFPRNNIVVPFYGGRPSLGRRRVSNLIPRPLTHSVWGHWGSGA